ncbi:hypothetical protein VN97_g11031 [Penicillium thymicola]|uniref:Uncharacterized protein n=1 Tax=Penicillium thymicola TaxID=293382 RepID=A0AAI9X3R2_PENTH|nr:hypothetical protein VN97_g11031 [Penicillium thymicola]
MFLCGAGFLEKKPNALDITGKELVVNLAQSSISLLDRYPATARPLQILPLMSWFVLWTPDSLGRSVRLATPHKRDGPSKPAFARTYRIWKLRWKVSRDQLTRDLQGPRILEWTLLAIGSSSHQFLEELEVRPGNSIIATAKPIPAISTFQSPAVTLAENARFDALFEEMVTSIPINRYVVSF